jgi:D-lactate dehydrogenase
MKVAVFSSKPYDRTFLEAANLGHAHELVFFETRLTSDTGKLAAGFVPLFMISLMKRL